eukprot:gene24332-29561_t
MAAAPATAEALPAQALGRDKEVDGLEARRKNVPPRDISTRESAESNNSAATNTARKTKSRGLDPVSTPNKAPPDSFRSCPRSPSPLSMGATGRKPPRKERSVEESIIRASSPFGLQPVTSVAQLKLSLPSGFMGVGGRELTPVPVSGSAEYSVLLAQLEKHRSDLSSVSKSYTAKYAELEKLKTLYEMEQMEHLGPKDPLPDVDPLIEQLVKKENDLEDALVKAELQIINNDIDNAKEKLQGAGMRFQVADANLQSIHDLLFPLAMGIVSITESLDVFRELGANYAVPTNLEGISVEEALSKEGAADVIVSRIKHSIEKLGTIMACQSKWDPKYVPPKRVETPKKVEKAKTKGKKKGKSPQPSPPPTPPAKEEPKEIDKGILFEPQNRLMQLSMQNSLTGGSNLSKFNIRIDLGAEDDGNYSDDDDADSISGERRSY